MFYIRLIRYTYNLQTFHCLQKKTIIARIMMTDEQISALFPSFEKGLVAEIAAAGQVRHFEEGDVLMRTGQNIRATMMVVNGLIKIYREDEEGSEFFMYYIKPGEACALSLICALKHETSAVMAKAAADSEVITVPLDTMERWMMKYKSWYQFVISTYRNRFEELLVTIDHIAFRNMDERLIFYLKRHQQTLQSNMIPATHTQIAAELNSSREVISRLLKKLADKDMVKVHRQYIEILDLDK